MQVIESGLVPVYEGTEGKRLINARELHQFLGNGAQFANWILDRIERYGFVEGQEFLRESVKTPAGGRPRAEFWITVGMAKQLCMVENNDKGREAREYFLQMEEQAKQITPAAYQMPQTFAQALRLAADQQEQIEQQKAAIATMAPKADFHDQVTAAVNCIEIGEFAKAIGAGPIKFFRWLKAHEILRLDNLPRQEHVDAGHLRVEERTRTDQDGNQRTYLITLVTGRGQPYLQKRWAQAGNVVQMQLANG